MAFQPMPNPGILSLPPPRPLTLMAHTRRCSFRQPYIGKNKDPCDLNNMIPIDYRDYPEIYCYPRPTLYYDTIYKPDQETSESESVGSSVGFDLNKPEEYRIPGMFILFYLNLVKYNLCSSRSTCC